MIRQQQKMDLPEKKAGNYFGAVAYIRVQFIDGTGLFSRLFIA